MTWRWRRWIGRADAEVWIARLAEPGTVNWTLLEQPGRKRLALDVYVESRAAAMALKKRWRGQVRAIGKSAFAAAGAARVTRVGRGLEIVHGTEVGRMKSAARLRLLIPHGMAFGSGEHSTTFMLLRALVTWAGDWARTQVLDLGTGSGVLALTARRLGARKIVATDFDADAVRVARENEALNFAEPLISWRQADVRRLPSNRRYDLVLANLFSGILGEAAGRIAGSVAPGGELWVSGVLRSQQEEVVVAYAKEEAISLRRVVRRGKWVMLQWRREQDGT